MTDTTPELSDAAAAIVHPDIEHPDPPEVTPEMLQVPPPFAQRESALLDIIRMYGSGRASWEQTRQALIDFDYAPVPPAAGAPYGPDAGTWWDDVENDSLTAAPDNSWPQLQHAADIGMITQDEFNEVLQARADRSTGDPAPDQAKAFDPAKHPHGEGGRWARKLANAREMLSGGTESEKVMVDQLKVGDVILHPGTEYHQPVVVSHLVAHPRKDDPHMQWRTMGLHDGTDEERIDKVHQGDYVDRIVGVPEDDQPMMIGLHANGARVKIEHEGHPNNGRILTVTGRSSTATGGIGGGGTVQTDIGPVSRYTRVVPAPFRLSSASQGDVADALDRGDARIRSQGGDRVWVDHGTTELSYDRVPGGPREGEWHGAYVSEYGNVGGQHPHGKVTDKRLLKHLSDARDRGAAARRR